MVGREGGLTAGAGVKGWGNRWAVAVREEVGRGIDIGGRNS